jgi:hypothetical protein
VTPAPVARLSLSVSRSLVLAALVVAGAPACDGLEDIPDDRIVCCRNGDAVFLIQRLECVWDPAGRVVLYEECGDASLPMPPEDADAGPDGGLSESR